MIDTTILETTYCGYLRSNRDPQIAQGLCRELNSVGLVDEASALGVYLKSGNGAIYTWQQGAWASKPCITGPVVPKEAAFGDLWFDTVELTLMVLVPNREGVSRDTIAWIATHPVYTWQFRAFLRLLKWNLYQAYFTDAKDLFDLQRFAEIDGMSFVRNVYHEEAAAFCIWFGKVLSDQAEFNNAKVFMDESMFKCMLPEDVLLWNSSEVPVSEFIRIAFNARSVGKTSQEQWKELQEHQAGNLPENPTLYDEWERNNRIGFSTVKPARWANKPAPRPPIRGYEFVRLLNTARYPNP